LISWITAKKTKYNGDKEPITFPSIIPESDGNDTAKDIKSDEKEKNEATYIIPISGEHFLDQWDWNLKQSAVIISRETFAWMNGSKADESLASLNFHLDKMPEKLHMKLHKALHRYVYPGLMLPSTFFHEIQSQNKSVIYNIKEQLQIEWMQGFESLYQLFINGSCNYFYLIFRAFTILFLSEDAIGKGKEIFAFLSRSTKGLRAIFKEKGISFDTPLFVEKEGSVIVHRQELLELSKTVGLDKTQLVNEKKDRIDNSASSLLVIKGRSQTDSLFKFLASIDPRLGEDVPTILSPIPFLNGTLKKLALKSQEVTRTTVNNGFERVYRIDIKGLMLPHQLHEILSLLQLKQTNFDIALEVDQDSLNFNYATSSKLGLTVLKSIKLEAGKVGIVQAPVLQNQFHL